MTTFRPFQPIDILNITAINLDRFTESYGFEFYLHYTFDYHQKHNKIAGIVENIQGRTIGFVLGKIGTLQNGIPYGHVSAVTVDATFRRLQLGKQLVQVLENISRSRGCYFIDLFVRKENEAATSMYSALGYTTFRQLINYYSDHENRDEVDAYDMQKSLHDDYTVHPIQESVHCY